VSVTFVGVSDKTFAQAAAWPASPELERVCFVPIDGEGPRGASADAIRILWRRQPDRTAWLHRAVDVLPNLAWIHTDTVGIERLPLATLRERPVVVSNARGIYAGTMAEWVLCIMLVAVKRLRELFVANGAGVWAHDVAPGQLRGRHAAILGCGSVAQALVPLCAAVGMETLCINRTGKRPESLTQESARVLGVDEGWKSALSTSDFLVIALPLTEQTERCVDKSVLSRLRRGAWLINVARAQIVDERDMLAALRERQLGGAWLDVFDMEPLPREHRLWQEPNVFVTPHLSGFSHDNEAASRALFMKELSAVMAGQAPLSRVDLNLGY
jgi:phosphoglycerate dehydrogenase-like enzyme